LVRGEGEETDMQEEERRPDEGGASGSGGGETRPQQAGEAETTRFGMEDGDNTDTPATGGPQADEKEG
jgi:hypothetical protein